MPYAFRRATVLSLVCLLTPGCTTTEATYRGSVAYNRAFDQARNEILLLNILRARDAYPLQFSTISSVTGSMRADLKATPTLANIIGHAADAAFSFGTGGEFGFRNPSVTISPLETKEFRKGMASPVDSDLVRSLLAQGWTPAVVEALVFDGFTELDADEPDLDSKRVIRRVTLPIADASKLLNEGLGANTSVEIDKDAVVKPGQLGVVIREKGIACIKGLPSRSDCGRTRQRARLRSPSGMIQYLASSLRPGAAANSYFRVIHAASRAPSTALVTSDFRGELYYIDGNETKSMETLALLAEIIGFQTTDATLNESKPTITVPAN